MCLHVCECLYMSHVSVCTIVYLISVYAYASLYGCGWACFMSVCISFFCLYVFLCMHGLFMSYVSLYTHVYLFMCVNAHAYLMGVCVSYVSVCVPPCVLCVHENQCVSCVFMCDRASQCLYVFECLIWRCARMSLCACTIVYWQYLCLLTYLYIYMCMCTFARLM